MKKNLYIVLPVMFALVAASLFFVPGAENFLELDRYSVVRGELWRFFTGHWVHCSMNHLFWDLVSFLVLALLCAKKNLKGFVIVTIVSMPLISGAVIWLCPEISCYRGLSGIDTALFFYYILLRLKESFKCGNRLYSAFFILLVGALAGKTSYEVYSGSVLFCRAGDFVPVPVAHMAGILAGAAVFAAALLIGKRAKLWGNVFFRAVSCGACGGRKCLEN